MLASVVSSLRGQATSAIAKQAMVITEPPKHVPSGKVVDGPLIGNGDLGVVIGGPPDRQRFYVGKDDFWSQQASAMSIGGIDLSIPMLNGASYREEEEFLTAQAHGTFDKKNARLLTTAWVSATENLFILGLKNDGNEALPMLARVFPNGASIHNNERSVSIGREGDANGRNYFNGLIDEVHVYNRALESNDLARVIRFDDQLPGLVRRWDFDDDAGKTPADTPAKLVTGPTCTGPVLVYRPAESPIDTPNGCISVGESEDYIRFAAGVRGRALKVMHSYDYIDAGQVPDLSKVTVSAWIYIFSAGDSNFILSKGQWDDAYSLSLDHGKLRFNVGDSFVRSANSLPTHQWVHVSGTFDGSVLRAYINGTEVMPRARTLTSGSEGDLLWMSRNADGPLDEEYSWPNPLPPATSTTSKGREVSVAMRLIGVAGTMKDDAIEFSLQPGATAYLVVPVMSDLDAPEHLQAATRRVKDLDTDKITRLETSHREWWKDFWSQSSVDIDDPLIEKFYYSSLYISASAMRDGKVFPAHYGPWVTTDHPGWNGDNNLDYNYETPVLGLYSANHVDTAGGYDQALLDFMVRGRMFARTMLNVRGVFYPAHIGPWGLEHSFEFEPSEGMKQDAAFATVPMMMRYYSTYDLRYAAKVYPFIKAVGEFWEDYLKKENGVYVIHSDCSEEIGPWLSKNWDTCPGASENPTDELAFVHGVFQGLLDLSEALTVDSDLRAKWQEILNHLSPYPVDSSSGKPMLLRGSDKKMGLEEEYGSHAVWPASQIGIGEDEKLREAALNDYQTFGYRVHPLVPPALARLGYDPERLLEGMHKHCLDHGYPNGYIFFSGGGIETLSIIPATVDEMLLQSFTGELRLFPSWPREHNAAFANLRAYGAFLVSSSIKGGEIQEVTIRSEKGRRCILKNPWPRRPVELVRNGRKTERLSGDTISFETRLNETIALHHE